MSMTGGRTSIAVAWYIHVWFHTVQQWMDAYTRCLQSCPGLLHRQPEHNRLAVPFAQHIWHMCNSQSQQQFETPNNAAV